MLSVTRASIGYRDYLYRTSNINEDAAMDFEVITLVVDNNFDSGKDLLEFAARTPEETVYYRQSITRLYNAGRLELS